MNTSKTLQTKEAKTVKKLTIKITDQDALAAAYPEVMETTTITVVAPNRKLLRPIVKAMHGIGKRVPGVDAYYATNDDEAEGEE